MNHQQKFPDHCLVNIINQLTVYGIFILSQKSRVRVYTTSSPAFLEKSFSERHADKNKDLAIL